MNTSVLLTASLPARLIFPGPPLSRSTYSALELPLLIIFLDFLNQKLDNTFVTEAIKPETVVDPIKIFGEYVAVQTDRLSRLRDLLEIELPRIENLYYVNERISDAGRPDLLMIRRVPVMPLVNPQDSATRVTNNFAPQMRFITGLGEADPEDFFKRRPLIGIKESELLGLIDDSFAFEENFDGNHSSKPAFIRMLILEPDFTRNLVLPYSDDPEDNRRYYLFAPELFVAYQFMSRLVDENDRGAIKADGTADEGYFCH